MNLKIIMVGLSISVSSVLLMGQARAQPVTTQDMNVRLDNLYGNHDNYRVFFESLKENIAKKNVKAVAAVVKYPMFVHLKGRLVRITTSQQFIKNYNAIITPKIEKIVQEQQFKELISTYRGLAFGNGEIWFVASCQAKICNNHNKQVIKIIGINNFM